MSVFKITELQGDGIGPELAKAVHEVAAAMPADFEFLPIDWSLDTRELERDLGGKLNTDEFTGVVVDRLPDFLNSAQSNVAHRQ